VSPKIRSSLPPAPPALAHAPAELPRAAPPEAEIAAIFEPARPRETIAQAPLQTPLYGGPIDLSKLTALTEPDAGIIRELVERWSSEPRERADALRTQVPALANVCTESLEALGTYVGNYYKTTNRLLRTIGRGEADPVAGRTVPKEESAIIKGTAVALNHLPPVVGTVFRKEGGTGIPLDAKPGTVVVDPGFLSTTRDRKVAENWQGAALLVIHASRRSHDVSQVSPFPNEREAIFLPGTRFEVLSNAGGIIELNEVE
jgi:hypothetical protein